MLKTLDFVDPLLAQRIHNLEQQMTRLEVSRLQIVGNKKLLPSVRQKLLRYQSDCQMNTKKMLQQQRDKLADYLDQQTSVITKNNREGGETKYSNKLNATCNQSTRIDFSMDETKSMETTTNKTTNKLVYQLPQQKLRRGNRYKQRIKRLDRKVEQQQKLINMLVTWVKIYHQKQIVFEGNNSERLVRENTDLSKINEKLMSRCQLLESELVQMRTQFKTVAEDMLFHHRKIQSLRAQNDGLKMQRKELLQTTRSLSKKISIN